MTEELQIRKSFLQKMSARCCYGKPGVKLINITIINTHTLPHIYISSFHATSTDLPDPLLPPFPIVYCSR